MPLSRDPVQVPLKPSKIFPFLNDNKACYGYRTTSFKVAILVFLVASVSLVLYSAFATRTRWFSCPECHYQTRNIARICSTHNISGENQVPTNISHLVFGIGGSTETWKDRKHYSQLWWDPNNTRGFVFLDRKPDPDSHSNSSPSYRISSNWARFKYGSSQSAVRISRVIVDAFRVGLPNVRWFVMGDDDTVFFTENLVSVLSRYDHRQMYYIGGNSESVEQNVMHSYGTAFGGGGFAISYPLAAELVKVFDGCLHRYYNFHGSDERVRACVAELGVSLTNERGFHQIDIQGDPYGLLAAHPVGPLVSLHHLGSVKSLFPNQSQHESLRTLMQAYHVDPARTMQQCFCHYPKHTWSSSISWSVSISWGYTVQIYPSFLTAEDLATPLQTFKTWRSWSNGPFTFNTRPVNPDKCQQPVVFYLDWVKDIGHNETLTSYKKYVVEKEKKCDKAEYARVMAVERIVVSALKMDPEDWKKKAPRRHCSEVSSLQNGSLKMKIRSCKQWETVTK